MNEKRFTPTDRFRQFGVWCFDKEQDKYLDATSMVSMLNKQQAIIFALKEMNMQLREINKDIGDDLYNCRLNKNIIRERLKLWQDVHKEYDIYSIDDFEELMKNVKQKQ